jgi:hypothetical protein
LANQSLYAVSTRLDLSPGIVMLLRAITVACTAAALWHRAPRLDALSGVAVTTLLAMLVSPLSWIHYRVLAIPAWVAVLAHASASPPAGAARIALLLAGIATSGMLTIAPRALKVALLDGGIFYWGVLLLLIVLAFQRLVRPAASPVPLRTP